MKRALIVVAFTFAVPMVALLGIRLVFWVGGSALGEDARMALCCMACLFGLPGGCAAGVTLTAPEEKWWQ